MMDHVEGGEMAKLLPENEEEGIKEVEELGDIVPVGDIQGSQGGHTRVDR